MRCGPFCEKDMHREDKLDSSQLDANSSLPSKESEFSQNRMSRSPKNLKNIQGNFTIVKFNYKNSTPILGKFFATFFQESSASPSGGTHENWICITRLSQESA